MGDRGNIVIVQDSKYRQDKKTHKWVKSAAKRDRLFFYGHWSGYRIADVVKTVIEQGERLNDTAYFGRIVFDTFTNGEKGTTGFGISTSIADNEHPLIVLDPQEGTVWFEDAGGQVISRVVKFAEFPAFVVPEDVDATAEALRVQDSE